MALGLAICRAAVKATILWHVEYWCCRFHTSSRQTWLCQVCVWFHQQTGIIAAPTKRIHYIWSALVQQGHQHSPSWRPEYCCTVGRISYTHELHGCCGTCYAWLEAGKCTEMYIWQEHCWPHHDWQRCRRIFADPQCSSANVVYNTHLVMHNATCHTL